MASAQEKPEADTGMDPVEEFLQLEEQKKQLDIEKIRIEIQQLQLLRKHRNHHGLRSALEMLSLLRSGR